MKKLLTYKRMFSLIGLIFTGVAVINALAYTSLTSLRYFTNQSNLILFLIFIMIYFNKENHKLFKYISFIGMLSIGITGVVYHLLLTDLMIPSTVVTIYDLNNFLNFLVHTFNPIYFVFYYLIFVNENVTYKKLWVGLIHPLLYFMIILATGPFTGFYAYPFLDVSLNGLGEVLKITLVIMMPLIIIFDILILFVKQKVSKFISKYLLK